MTKYQDFITDKKKFLIYNDPEVIFILAASNLVNKKDSEDAEVKTNRLALAKYFASRDPEKFQICTILIRKFFGTNKCVKILSGGLGIKIGYTQVDKRFFTHCFNLWPY